MARLVTWWVSTPKWTARVSVDEQGRIVEAAPIVSWARGQLFDSFVRTLQVRYPGEVEFYPLKVPSKD